MPYSIRCLIYVDVNLKSIAALRLYINSSRNLFPTQDVPMPYVDKKLLNKKKEEEEEEAL